MSVPLVLAHGASGSAASMRPWVDGLALRGVGARAIDLPVRRAEDAVGSYASAAGALDAVAIGGHSYGGRVASLLAAGPGVGPWGLVLLSYPLHRPGAPDLVERTRHWSGLRCPVLLLSGESDPFARIDLLREAVATHLPAATLVTWPRLGHGLAPVLDEALDLVARFLRDLPARTEADGLG